MDRCPYCGSSLIWDHSSGSVVCGGCGSVVSPIYYDHQYVQHHQHRRRGKYSYVPKGLKEIEREAEVIRRRERKLISLKVVSSLPEEVKRKAEKGISVIKKVRPSLLCKSLRSVYALGYILHTLSEVGQVDYREVSKVFKVSRSTVYRLMYEARSLLGEVE